MQCAFAQADRRVQAGEALEADVKVRHGSARTKLTVLMLEDVFDAGVRGVQNFGTWSAALYCGRWRWRAEESLE